MSAPAYTQFEQTWGRRLGIGLWLTSAAIFTSLTAWTWTEELFR